MNNENTHNLNMIQMWLDTRQLSQLGRMLHLPLKRVGNNYLVHCALSELFQEQAPNPFCVEDQHRQITDYKNKNGRHIRTLCYSELDWETLQNLSRGFASPAVYEIVDWDRMASKPMPNAYPAGMKLGFELRACPVVRKASDGPKWNKGQEIDAFLSRVWEIDDPAIDVDRGEIYTDWLKRQLEIRKGAKLISGELKRYSIERMSRRNHKSNRKLKTIKRPDVTLTGKLEVTDNAAFKDLLKQGIGRHKSFGFGMLKIRRA
jgi:CRISPR system Cascade subunit CasE